MRLALSSSKASYYISKDPIGQDGDFITAPEVSQLFGEMIALWCIDKWLKMSSKVDNLEFNLVELGPGRGTLMYDILRISLVVAPLFFASIRKVLMVEVNENFKKSQLEKLSCFGICLQHIDDTSCLDDFPSIIVANEFFDALPIKQYKKTDASDWQEVVIRERNAELYFDTIFSDIKLADYKGALIGGIVEISPSSILSMQECCRVLSNNFGAMLVIDYGYDLDPSARQPHQYSSTLQGIKNHKYHDVFKNLGDADLTAHVDFHALKQVCYQNNLKNILLARQGDFLKSLGIDFRLQKLLAANPSDAKALIGQYNYLLKDMGTLFKVLSVNNF